MRLTLKLLSKPPVIRLSNASFYRSHPSSDSEQPNALFPNLSLELPSAATPGESWGVIGSSSSVRTDFLNALRGKLLCLPPTARSYPYLSTDEVARKDSRLRSPIHAIQYVGFDADRGVASIRGSYLSQRYESKREKSDFTLEDYLLGNTELNAADNPTRMPQKEHFASTVKDLKLEKLLDMPVSHLSNGQTRRSKIAKALLASPEVLMLDSPFMGLDVTTVEHLSQVLERLATSSNPRIILSLRANEYIPLWLTRLFLLQKNHKVHSIERYQDMVDALEAQLEQFKNVGRNKRNNRTDNQRILANVTEVSDAEVELADDTFQLLHALNPRSRAENARRQRLDVLRSALQKEGPGKHIALRGTLWESRDGFLAVDMHEPVPEGEPLIEMDGVQVAYGDKIVLGNWKQGLVWTVRRGQRWGVFGPNGSGKTTLTALISSDHPQSYSLPIKFFGRARLPEIGRPGISFFDIQSRIGVSSPELHAFFPKSLSIRQTLESAWADAPLSKPKFTSRDDDLVVSRVLRWFQAELCPELGPSELFKSELYRPRVDDIHMEEGAKRKLYATKRPEELHRAHQDEYVMGSINTAWADEKTFGSSSPMAQRVLLFLRAIIKQPDMVILDEAFSGMDPYTLQKCHTFLSHGDRAMLRMVGWNRTEITEPYVMRSDIDALGLSKFPGLSNNQALIAIAHRATEVPGCVRHWICLPEPGEGQPRSGVFDGPVETDSNKWRTIWNLPLVQPPAGTNGRKSSSSLKSAANQTTKKKSMNSERLADFLKMDLAISKAILSISQELPELVTEIATHSSKMLPGLLKSASRVKKLVEAIFNESSAEARLDLAKRTRTSRQKEKEKENAPYLERETHIQRQKRLKAMRRHYLHGPKFQLSVHWRELQTARLTKELYSIKRRILLRQKTCQHGSLADKLELRSQFLIERVQRTVSETITVRRKALLEAKHDRLKKGVLYQCGKKFQTHTHFAGLSIPKIIRLTERAARKIQEYVCRRKNDLLLIKTSSNHYSPATLVTPVYQSSPFSGLRFHEVIEIISKAQRRIYASIRRREAEICAIQDEIYARQTKTKRARVVSVS